MSSFLAHGVVAMAVWGFARRTAPLEPFQHRAWYGAAAVVAILPDVDTLVGLAHRGVTHTLGFAVAVSGLIVACAAFVHGKRAVWLLLPFATAIWLHGVMDLLVGGGPRVALFAPLWNEALPAIDGGLPLHRRPRGWSGLLPLLTENRTLVRMVIEAGIFGPILAASLVRQRRYQVMLVATGTLTWLIYGSLR